MPERTVSSLEAREKRAHRNRVSLIIVTTILSSPNPTHILQRLISYMPNHNLPIRFPNSQTDNFSISAFPPALKASHDGSADEYCFHSGSTIRRQSASETLRERRTDEEFQSRRSEPISIPSLEQ